MEQYQSLKSKAATACRKGEAKDAKAIDALKADKPGSDAAWDTANTAIFDVLNEMTAPDCAFQQTLSERYFEDGHGAMQFLKNWWATETNDTRATTAAEEYKVKAAQKLPTSTDAKTFATHINAMRTLQSGLKKTDRAVSEATFAMDVADLTRRMGQEYDTELRTWALETQREECLRLLEVDAVLVVQLAVVERRVNVVAAELQGADEDGEPSVHLSAKAVGNALVVRQRAPPIRVGCIRRAAAIADVRLHLG